MAPIYLLRRDFTLALETQAILAQDADVDVRRFAWSPDGTVGVGLLADVLVSIEPGAEKRRLADGISTITFGEDASTVYAVRVTEDGANDVATVLAIDFLSGDTTELAAPTYARPEIGAEEAVAEGEFADEGGAVRLYWVEGGTLRLWALGAGTWQIDPADGALTELEPTRGRCSGRRTPTEESRRHSRTGRPPSRCWTRPARCSSPARSRAASATSDGLRTASGSSSRSATRAPGVACCRTSSCGTSTTPIRCS